MHAGEEDQARLGWTTSRRGQDSPWKSQSEWQRTGINGKSTSIVWPILGSRTAKEQDRTARRWYSCRTWRLLRCGSRTSSATVSLSSPWRRMHAAWLSVGSPPTVAGFSVYPAAAAATAALRAGRRSAAPLLIITATILCLQFFDAVGWAAGRAPGP